MLSQAAFNAFLKTLEEPPPYAIFILATTEKHKIIPTILSRCQIFDFKRIQIPEMVAHLQNICKEEGIDAEKDALHIIGQKADGALRDSLSIFDRIASSVPDKKITYDSVISNLNILDYDYYFRVMDAMLTEDISSVMLIFNEITNKGFEPDIFINGLAGHLRNLLICKDEKTLKLLEVGENVRARYHEQARLSSMSYLLTALNIANDCDVNYRMARNKRLHVEMAIIKMAFINRAIDIANNPQANISTEKKTPDLNGSQTTAQNTSVSPKNYPEKNTSAVQVQEAAPKPQMPTFGGGSLLDKLKAEVKEDEQKTEEKPDLLNQENLEVAWAAFTTQVESPLIKGQFKTSKIKLDGETIRVGTSGKVAKESIPLEPGLMAFMREKLACQTLKLECYIDDELKKAIEAEAPKAPAAPLTNMDKYKVLSEKNASLDELRKRFDLTFDE